MSTKANNALFPSGSISGNNPQPITSYHDITPESDHKTALHNTLSPHDMYINKLSIEKSVAEALYTQAIREKENLRCSAKKTLSLLKSQLLTYQQRAKQSSKRLEELEIEKTRRFIAFKKLKESLEGFKQKPDSSVWISMMDFPFQELETYLSSEEKHFQTSSKLNELNIVSPSEISIQSLATPTSNIAKSSRSYADKQRIYFEDRIKILSEENRVLKSKISELERNEKSNIRGKLFDDETDFQSVQAIDVSLQEQLASIRSEFISRKEFKEVQLKMISRQLSQRLDKLHNQLSRYNSESTQLTLIEELEKLKETVKELDRKVTQQDKENRELKKKMNDNECELFIHRHQGYIVDSSMSEIKLLLKQHTNLA